MKNTQDKRVVKTRRAIREALITLLRDREMEDITVVLLAETAQVNRKTFYAHYEKVEDVGWDLINEFVEQIAAYMEQARAKKKPITAATFVELFAQAYPLHPDLFRDIFTAPNYAFLSQNIQIIMKREIMRYLHIPRRSPKHSHVISFVIGGLFGAYRDWFASGQKMPLSELTELLSNMVSTYMPTEV